MRIGRHPRLWDSAPGIIGDPRSGEGGLQGAGSWAAVCLGEKGSSFPPWCVWGGVVFVCSFPEEPWEREKRINLNIQFHKQCHKNHIHLQAEAQR